MPYHLCIYDPNHGRDLVVVWRATLSKNYCKVLSRLFGYFCLVQFRWHHRQTSWISWYSHNFKYWIDYFYEHAIPCSFYVGFREEGCKNLCIQMCFMERQEQERRGRWTLSTYFETRNMTRICTVCVTAVGIRAWFYHRKEGVRIQRDSITYPKRLY